MILTAIPVRKTQPQSKEFFFDSENIKRDHVRDCQYLDINGVIFLVYRFGTTMMLSDKTGNTQFIIKETLRPNLF
jgi:hypothetical protein